MQSSVLVPWKLKSFYYNSRGNEDSSMLQVAVDIIHDQLMVHINIKIKVISDSRSFKQIISVWISIPKWVVGFRPNALLFLV